MTPKSSKQELLRIHERADESLKTDLEELAEALGAVPASRRAKLQTLAMLLQLRDDDSVTLDHLESWAGKKQS